MSATPASQSRFQRARTELRGLMVLATPIIIAQLANTAMGFVDTVMAGRVGPRDLAAVALGNSIWIPVFLLMTGILLATTPKVAQRFGAGEHASIGALVRQALWLALVVGGCAAMLLWNAEIILHKMNVEPDLIGPAMGYLRAVACGFPAVALYHVLRCFSDGLGLTRPSMILGLCGLVLNIPLNYIFIYGKFGLPAMGGVGCGWATGLVMGFMLLGMLTWVKIAKAYRDSQLFSQFDWPQWAVIKRLVSIGLPIGIAVFAESSIFAVIALLIGGLGSKVVAGHQIALNFSSIVFMIPYSLGMAATVRVGQALGRGHPRDARFAAGVSMATALAYACLSCTLILLFREPIVGIYTDNAEVIALAASLIVYAALFQLSDAVQVTAAGALRGYQDTRVTMLLTLFAYWGIGLPIGYALGLTDWLGEPSGPRGLWQGLVVGLTCAAIMLGYRVSTSARKRIKSSTIGE
ncbi:MULTISPECIES: MATE family efflux transporter [Pseudomonas]|jgi:MATE family multidrug resistance protein|uniref:Multidrug-efflux transporter n=1 Tax=Pseudomonas marincola TaxID=437900 RepID=A0A1I7C273_9PSED|nr:MULTISPECIES: MATE family efflux transporter [Pseudomonas]MBV16582.1 MATE family efflux transporter [Thalassospira sp.]NRH29589.1 MATE family efflux transporter [Pseudomonas sp. MS19]CAE6922005.1 Multidrug resistance protein PmpM [Pseudomonas marincola]SFT93514.1 multidrug resistance protein, MATE family [Pseudomonas marincola]